MTLEDDAWLACAFDCDGAIGWQSPTKYYSKKRPLIQLVNTKYPFVKQVQKVLGYGNITVQNRKDPRWKSTPLPIYAIRISKRKIVKDTLTRIIPYLIIKKKIAEEILAFVT
jgi:hypothetical protein